MNNFWMRTEVFGHGSSFLRTKIFKEKSNEAYIVIIGNNAIL